MNDERIWNLEATLSEKLGLTVVYSSVCKLNMTMADCFVIGDGAKRMRVYVNMEWTDEYIVNHVMGVWEHSDEYMQSAEEIKIDMLNDRDYVLKNVERSVVSTQLNKGVLDKYIHREYLDLSVIYKVVLLRDDNGRYTITISKALAEKLDLTIEDLERASVMNKGVECYITASVQKIIMESGVLTDEEKYLADNGGCPMYTISSRDGIEGASSILHTSLFAGLAAALNHDLFILPSSIHELICIPDLGQHTYFLREMVASVNSSSVEPEEILGSSVYRYNRRRKTITIAQ